MTEPFRTVPQQVGGTTETADAAPDLLLVALAAYAAHLANRARVIIPGAATPWGRSARMAGLRQPHRR